MRTSLHLRSFNGRRNSEKSSSKSLEVASASSKEIGRQRKLETQKILKKHLLKASSMTTISINKLNKSLRARLPQKRKKLSHRGNLRRKRPPKLERLARNVGK